MHDKFFDQGRNRAQSHDGILIVISNPGQGAYDRAAFGAGLLPFMLDWDACTLDVCLHFVDDALRGRVHFELGPT